MLIFCIPGKKRPDQASDLSREDFGREISLSPHEMVPEGILPGLRAKNASDLIYGLVAGVIDQVWAIHDFTLPAPIGNPDDGAGLYEFSNENSKRLIGSS